jgi:hypothetical protein
MITDVGSGRIGRIELIDINLQEIKSGKEHLKEEMRAGQEFMKEEIMAKSDAHHERMMSRMHSQLQKWRPV